MLHVYHMLKGTQNAKLTIFNLCDCFQYCCNFQFCSGAIQADWPLVLLKISVKISIFGLMQSVGDHQLTADLFFLRFEEGLATLGLLDAMRQHPHVFRPVLTVGTTSLTRDEFAKTFRLPKNLGVGGTNARQVESRYLTYWSQLMQDIEGNCILHILITLFKFSWCQYNYGIGIESQFHIQFPNWN